MVDERLVPCYHHLRLVPVSEAWMTQVKPSPWAPLPDCRPCVHCWHPFPTAYMGCLPKWVGVQTAQQGFSYRIKPGNSSPLNCCVWIWSVIRLYLTLLFLKTEDKWRDSETLYHTCFYFYSTPVSILLAFPKKKESSREREGSKVVWEVGT